MAGWIDWLVVSIVIIFGLIIFYKALKEPADMLFGLIGRGLGSIRDKLSDAGGGGYETIRYG